MDIAYLLFLQDLRDGTLAWLAPAASWISKFAVSFWPVILVCVIYWVFDRKSGKNMLFGLGLGILLNGFLKLVFCVNRPWIVDSRVQPYGSAKLPKSSYSFPSGHSTWATAVFGGTGFWLRKKSRFLSILCFIVVLFIMFSRNFLGFHTPQDVIAGCLTAVVMMFAAYGLEKWTDKNTGRDKYLIIAGIALCAVLVVFYIFKSYPLTYQADGSLLVDPATMKADSFEGIGFISSYVICRYFERRYLAFDEGISRIKRFITAVIACIPIVWWQSNAVSMFTKLVNRSFGKFMQYFILIFFIMIVVPGIMCLLFKKRKGTVASPE